MKWQALCVFFGVVFSGFSAPAQIQIIPLNTAPAWQCVEFRITGLPAVSNPFDPDQIQVDGVFTLPGGGTMTVPAFWFQDYTRGSSGGYEYLTVNGPPEWRLRFVPPVSGGYSVSLSIRTNGLATALAASTNFSVAPAPAPPGSGYVRLAPGNQYLQTADGQPLRLIGENVGWHGGAGTADYDTWFASMQSAGENYARTWMCPWAFGIECDANSLTHYRLDRAWQLDYVLKLAEQRGIYLLLCLDYHGMFEVTPDYWGGNNYWPLNPYNTTNGGPCLNQDGFFTNSVAAQVYQKRLRYLVGRYGCSPNLLAWQFLNEIDNVYAYLVPADVAAWHGRMGGWLHTNDPWNHLVTTSLTGGSDRPEIWAVPQLDFACYHSYAETAPAQRLAAVSRSFLQRYAKPVLIDEFGTDWRGWNRPGDPYLRGWRQGIWGGALGGSMGTGMSWFWEDIQSENDYPAYTALGSILNRTGWGQGTWTNISFLGSGTPPTTVGGLVPGGQPFNATLMLSGTWAGMPSGRFAVPDSLTAANSVLYLNSFVHGIWHSDLKTPFVLSAWLTNNARLVLHVNSVSEQSTLVVRADGVELFRTNLPNLDGYWQVTNEYNFDIPVNLPAGNRIIEVTNAGNDWFYLDWVRLENVLPASYAGSWKPSPDAIGLAGPRESLLYITAPNTAFPVNATNSGLPLQQGLALSLSNWPAGNFIAEWYYPGNGTVAGTSRGSTTNGILVLGLPDFTEDLAGIVYPPPRLVAPVRLPSGVFQFQLQSETGGRYYIDSSSDLASWSVLTGVTNSTGALSIQDPAGTTGPRQFYRARRSANSP
ncbi:MAG: DUF5060 domain-containing protein [Verrucomicrobiota bacterium]